MRDGVDEFTLLCEGCGYVIEGLPREGNCPECGKAVEESLPERRDRVPGMWRTMRHPRWTLDRMPIDPPEKAWRRLLIRGAIGGSLVGAATVLGAFYVLVTDMFFDWFGPEGIAALLGIPVASLAVAAAVIALSWVETLGLRFFGRRRGYRISKAVSLTIVSHGAIWWIIASLVLSIGGLGTLVGEYALVDSSGLWIGPLAGDYLAIRLPTQAWHFPFVLSPLFGVAGLGVGFLFFEVFAYLGLRRCKFANRVRPALPSDGVRTRVEEHEKNAEARR